MNSSIGSPTISTTPEEKRSLSRIDSGDVLNIQRFTHVWGDPETPGAKSHIARGSIPMRVSGKTVFHCIYLANGRIDEPLTPEFIEERMNALGWFRRPEG